MTTSANWQGQTLFISWNGGEEEAAYWIYDYCQRTKPSGRLIFNGYDETFNRHYPEKPTAEQALSDIIAWQNGS